MKLLEQMAVLTALEKIVKDRKNELRQQADAEFLEEYEERGIKKQELRLDGNKVGEFIVNMNKPGFEVSNKQMFEEFALCNGLASKKRVIDPWKMQQAVNLLEAYMGEEAESLMLDEVVYEDGWQKALDVTDGEVVLYGSSHIVPGVTYVPESPKNTQIRGCKPEDVLPIMRRLGGVDQLLLGE